jgi:hypothetical protein
MRGKAPFWEHEGEMRHIDLECDDDPCFCAGILKPWRDSWSKMPKRFLGERCDARAREGSGK